MAKAILTLCVLFAYLLLVIQPAIPFLHYTFQKDYYAQILCVNKAKPSMHCEGKCALKKEIKEKQSQPNARGDSPLSQNFISVAPHCPPQNNPTLWPFQLPPLRVGRKVFFSTQFSGLPEIPPPEFSA